MVASLPDLGYDGEPHFAFLHIEDRVRLVALREDDLLFREQIRIFLPSPMVARKVSESKPRFFFVVASGLISADYSPPEELLMSIKHLGNHLLEVSYSAQYLEE